MRIILGLALTVSASSAGAADAPFAGVAHNTRDNGWISYECEPVEHGRLTCDLTQLMVRKKLSSAEVDRKFREMTDGWPESLATEYKTTPDKIMESEQMRKLCALSTAYLGLLRGTGNGSGLPAEAVASVSSLTPLEKRDREQQSAAVVDSCTTRNLDGFKRSIRLSLEQDSRTCLVSMNRFQQTFRANRDAAGKLLAWTVADTTPQGDCGFVQMSRFVPADPDGSTNTLLWNYVGKRATSNPEGTVSWATDISCKEWDESETLYEWRKQEIALQCDYIDHSPL